MGMLDYMLFSAPGRSWTNKFGLNPDVDAAEDVWFQGGSWVAPTAARIHNLVSTDADDTVGGAGCRAVMVFGLDANWDKQSETVLLNGTTNAPTVNVYQRIYRLKGTRFGASGGNEGAITATAVTDATVTIGIGIGLGQSLFGLYTTARARTGYITQYYADLAAAGSTVDVEMRLWKREEADSGEAGWTLLHAKGLLAIGQSGFLHPFNPYATVPEKTDVRLEAVPQAGTNIRIAGGFDLVEIGDEDA